MGTLLRELSACCEDQSSNTRPFRFDVVPTASLMRRASDLSRHKLLGVWSPAFPENECAGGPVMVRVVSNLAPRVVVAPNKRTEDGIAVSAQMGVNYARMEVQGQPWGGWVVDVSNQRCACNYYYVFGTCIHVLAALRATAHVDSSGHSVLVSRKKRKRPEQQPGRQGERLNQGGRPRSIGPALSFT